MKSKYHESSKNLELKVAFDVRATNRQIGDLFCFEFIPETFHFPSVMTRKKKNFPVPDIPDIPE